MKNIFISYSCDNSEHVNWVKAFADRLRENAEVIFDQTNLDIGDNKDVFMERLSEADFVVPILTPEYHKKVRDRSVGVGYEFSMVVDYLQRNTKHNCKVLPVLRRGEIIQSIPVQLRQFVFLDLRDDANFDVGVNKLLNRMNRDGSFVNEIDNSDPMNLLQSPSNILSMENEINYADPNVIKSELDKNFDLYFEKYFTESREKAISASEEIEETVEEYTNSFEQQFNPDKMVKYQKRLVEFRDKVVAEHLWTVRSALRSREEELVRYKAAFKRAKPGDIYRIISNILRFAVEYKKETWSTVGAETVTTIEELGLDGIYEDDLILPGVIGLGIRSEILHRKFPAVFPIMTRRSQWGMHFLSGNAMEFLRYEYDNYNEETRVVNQFEYDYARFTFYTNYLSVLLKHKLSSLQIPWNEDIRFGYANLFISHVFELNKGKYKELHDWK